MQSLLARSQLVALPMGVRCVQARPPSRTNHVRCWSTHAAGLAGGEWLLVSTPVSNHAARVSVEPVTRPFCACDHLHHFRPPMGGAIMPTLHVPHASTAPPPCRSSQHTITAFNTQPMHAQYACTNPEYENHITSCTARAHSHEGCSSDRHLSNKVGWVPTDAVMQQLLQLLLP